MRAFTAGLTEFLPRNAMLAQYMLWSRVRQQINLPLTPLWRFVILAPFIDVMTYLLTYLIWGGKTGP